MKHRQIEAWHDHMESRYQSAKKALKDKMEAAIKQNFYSEENDRWDLKSYSSMVKSVISDKKHMRD